MILAFVFGMAFANEAVEKIESARAGIGETEKQQREALSNLFEINQRIKDIAKKSAKLNDRLMGHEGNVRALAQDVQTLESKSVAQQNLLNARLRQLYHDRNQTAFQWLFSAQSPVEMERAHRFLKLMVDSDHRQLKRYLAGLKELRDKRVALKGMVAQLARVQKDVRNQEGELTRQMQLKARLLGELKATRDLKVTELRELRRTHQGLETEVGYAFFERRSAMRAPVDGHLIREYGTFVDPTYRFRLMHKGLFYGAAPGADVRAIHRGRVAVASSVPGLGPTLILDHGDNYYSVYAGCARLHVREGGDVHEGDVIAASGEGSPLFGPGLYFEIRHFTDAVDPRSWIKDPGMRTASKETP